VIVAPCSRRRKHGLAPASEVVTLASTTSVEAREDAISEGSAAADRPSEQQQPARRDPTADDTDPDAWPRGAFRARASRRRDLTQ